MGQESRTKTNGNGGNGHNGENRNDDCPPGTTLLAKYEVNDDTGPPPRVLRDSRAVYLEEVGYQVLFDSIEDYQVARGHYEWTVRLPTF